MASFLRFRGRRAPEAAGAAAGEGDPVALAWAEREELARLRDEVADLRDQLERGRELREASIVKCGYLSRYKHYTGLLTTASWGE